MRFLRRSSLSKIEVRAYRDEDLKRFLEFLKVHIKQLGDLESKINAKFEEINTDLDLAREKAMKLGAEIAAKLPLAELEKEITKVDIELADMADVSEDVERTYDSYMKLYEELKEKAKKVEANRQKFHKLFQEKYQQLISS